MARRATAKNDLSPYAAAIQRWENEGGAPPQASEQKRVKTVREHHASFEVVAADSENQSVALKRRRGRATI